MTFFLLPSRKHKKVPMNDHQPPMRAEAANEVGSINFVFERSADGR